MMMTKMSYIQCEKTADAFSRSNREECWIFCCRADILEFFTIQEDGRVRQRSLP